MDSAQAFVDPADLRKFAQELNAFSEHVTRYHEGLLRELQRLGRTCRDSKYAEFREDFSRSETLLKKFVAAARETSPKLVKDAEVIEELQATRIDR